MLASGCRATPSMLKFGWQVHSYALAGQNTDQGKPVATKDAGGNLVFAFQLSEIRRGPFGGESLDPTRHHLRRATNVVHVTDLCPLTNAPPMRSGDDIRSTPGTHVRFVALDQPVPLAPKQDSDARWRQEYPDYECVLYDYGWLWFVPTDKDTGPPLGAYVIKRDTFRTPGYAYPLRIVCLPVALVADLTLWPFMGH